MKSKNKDLIKYPLMGYIGYGVTKLFSSFKKVSYLLDSIETLLLRDSINKLTIDRPVYIIGLARA